METHGFTLETFCTGMKCAEGHLQITCQEVNEISQITIPGHSTEYRPLVDWGIANGFLAPGEY